MSFKSCSTECQLYHASNLPKRSLQKFLVYAILQPGHPDHLLLEGANNRNVKISHRFLAAPVQANRLANQLYISIVSTRLNIRASYQSAYSGLRFLGEIPAGVMILSMYEFQPQTSIRSDWGSRPPGPSPWDVGNNLREFGIQD